MKNTKTEPHTKDIPRYQDEAAMPLLETCGDDATIRARRLRKTRNTGDQCWRRSRERKAGTPQPIGRRLLGGRRAPMSKVLVFGDINSLLLGSGTCLQIQSAFLNS